VPPRPEAVQPTVVYTPENAYPAQSQAQYPPLPIAAPAHQGEHTVGSAYDSYSPIGTYDDFRWERPRKGIRVVRRRVQVVQKNHADHSTWIPNWGQSLGPRLYPATEINASDAEEAFRTSRYGPLVVINDSIRLDIIRCGKVLETMPVWIHGTLQCQQAHVERLLQVLHRVRLSEGAFDMFSSTMVTERAIAAVLYQILFFSESAGDLKRDHPYIDRERFITWGACFLRGTLSQLDFPSTARDFVEQPQRTLFTYVELNGSQSIGRHEQDIGTDKSRYGFGLCMAVVQVTDEVVIVQHCKYVLLFRDAVHGDKSPVRRSPNGYYFSPSSAGNNYNVVGQCFASTLDESLNLGDLEQSLDSEDVDSRRYASDDSAVGRSNSDMGTSNSDVGTSDMVKRSTSRKSDLERFGSPVELNLC
jgi:hypothetical protein